MSAAEVNKKADESNLYIFRPYIQSDVNFVLSSWANSFYHANKCNYIFQPEQFHSLGHRLIRDDFFKRPSVAVIICCSKEEPDLILGWIAIEETQETDNIILHYIYVKEAFKNEGIGKKLLELVTKNKKEIHFTHFTDKAAKILSKAWKYSELNKTRNKYANYYYKPRLCRGVQENG